MNTLPLKKELKCLINRSGRTWSGDVIYIGWTLKGWKSHSQHCLRVKQKSFWSSLRAQLLHQHLHASPDMLGWSSDNTNSVTHQKWSLSTVSNPADLFGIYSEASFKCKPPHAGSIYYTPKKKREAFCCLCSFTANFMWRRSSNEDTL